MTTARTSRWTWIGAAAIPLAVFVLYQPALAGEFLWDDDANVTANPLLAGPRQLWRIWTSAESYQYYPLTFTSYWLQRGLWNLDARSCHLVNVALHAANAVVLLIALQRLRVRGALVAAAVFAVHPVCVESVAWITERKNVLSGLFFLLSFLAFVRFDDERRPGAYAWSLAAFALAALAKSHAIVLPGALAVLLWWRRRPLREAWRLLPYFALAIALATVTVLLERVHVVRDSGGAEWSASVVEKVAVAGRIVWFYAGKLVVPHPLVFIYESWEVDAGAWRAWLPLAGLVAALGVFAWRRDGWGRHALFASAYYVVALAPVLGFFDVYFMRYAYVQDHFQYLACMGLIAGLVAGGAVLIEALTTGSARRIAQIVVPVAVLCVLGALTWRQQGDYRDLETLWTRTIEKNPRAWMALTNLGILRVEAGDGEAGIALHERAIAIKDDVAEPHNNLGFTLERAGRFAEAERHYRRATELEPYDPISHLNLGNALFRQEQLAEAGVSFARALELNPDYLLARNNLGLVHASSGRLGPAVDQWLRILRDEPEFRDAYRNLRGVLAQDSPAGALRTAEGWARVAGDDNPALLDLLAAVQDAAGETDRARSTARRALVAAEARGDSWLTRQARERLRNLE